MYNTNKTKNRYHRFNQQSNNKTSKWMNVCTICFLLSSDCRWKSSVSSPLRPRPLYQHDECVCVYCAIKVDLLLIIHSLYLLLSFNLLSIAIIEEWIVMLHCLIYLLYIYTSTIYYIGINFHTITIAQKLKATYYRDWTRSLVYSIIYLYDRQQFEIALLLNLTLNIFFIVVPIRIV